MQTTSLPFTAENRIRAAHTPLGSIGHSTSLAALLGVAPCVAADIAVHAQSTGDEYSVETAHAMFIAWMDADMAGRRKN